MRKEAECSPICYQYKYAKHAETLCEVKDAIRCIRAKRKDAEIVIHIQGAWPGCPEAIILPPAADIENRSRRLAKLLKSRPFQRVVVVPLRGEKK